jgi:hypothetical protein
VIGLRVEPRPMIEHCRARPSFRRARAWARAVGREILTPGG